MFKAVVVLALAALVLADDKCFTPYYPCPMHVKQDTAGVVVEMWEMSKGLEGAQKMYMEAFNSTTLVRTDVKNDKGEFITVSHVVVGDQDVCTETWTAMPTPASSAAPAPSEPCFWTYDEKKDADCPDGSKGCKQYCASGVCITADSKDRVVEVGGVKYTWFDKVEMSEFTCEPCEGGNQGVKTAPKETCAASFAKVALLALVALFAALL